MRFNFLTRAKTNGAGIFVKRLQDQFLLNGHQRSWLRPDVQLTISAPKVKLNIPKISLVRVDGVYYDELRNELASRQLALQRGLKEAFIFAMFSYILINTIQTAGDNQLTNKVKPKFCPCAITINKKICFVTC